MSNWKDVLEKGAHELGITLTGEEETCFEQFLHLLLERNQQINLTAITDPVEIAVKHFVDALTLETIWHPHAGDRALDIGTGAGFPGIPVAIRHPKVQVALNDSTRKKVDFLQETADTLHLENIITLWARAEALGRDPHHRAKYNIVFARAVAHLATLIEYALPLLKVGGTFIAMKGPGGETEVTESARALECIGGKIVQVHRLMISGAGERLLIEVLKTRRTPEQYPRESAAIKKKPLNLDSGRSTP